LESRPAPIPGAGRPDTTGKVEGTFQTVYKGELPWGFQCNLVRTNKTHLIRLYNIEMIMSIESTAYTTPTDLDYPLLRSW
jgi:hypothetical protein